MGTQFDWEFEDHPEEKSADQPTHQRPNPWWWLATLGILLMISSAWYTVDRWLDDSDEQLKAYVQTTLNHQQDAFLEGDGELFFDTFTADSALRAAQLLPSNQEGWLAGYTVTNVEQLDSMVLVNAEWTVDGLTQQRIFFYEQTVSGLRQRPSPTFFWGAPETISYEWGKLVIYQTDREWADLLAGLVGDAAAYLCAADCPPLNLIIAPDYTQTAVPQTLLFPSPRLIGLGTDGQPSLFYQQLLQSELTSYYDPTPIRFAVPSIQVNNYREFAAEFMALNPTLAIEILPLEELSENPAELLTTVDGAALALTEQMLTAGLIHDLTYYANTDPDFNRSDFYEQMWLAAWWEKRMWFMPQMAEMNVVYYSPQAYEQAGLTNPSLRWTWDEMQRDARALTNGTGYEWGITDIGRDLLFSYAYNQANSCADTVTVRCNNGLTDRHITAALTFYQETSFLMPDLLTLNDIDRQNNLLTLVSPAARGTALWVNKAVEYETHSQQHSAGVRPFPGSERFDGITPLWVQGSVISIHSEQPRAVWEWLKFISHKYPVRTSRLIPARPSVAKAAGYWDTLPQPLDDAMRTAFPFARPVFISEQTHFSDAQLSAIRTGASPEEVTHQRPRLRWFHFPSPSSE